MKPWTTILFCASMCLQAQAGESVVEAVEVFEAMDVFQLEYASDPQVSPDGKRVVYVRKSNDVMTDKTNSAIWIVDSGGDNHRPLVSGDGSYTAPRWSHDGLKLAYLAADSGSTQVQVLWLGQASSSASLTNLRKKPSALSWSPDGKWLAFIMSVPKKVNKLAKVRKKPEGAKWSAPARVIDTVRYQFDGRGIVEPEFSHVFLLRADGGTPRQLTRGDFNHRGPLCWSPDSERILFSANRHPDWQLQTIESDIYAVVRDSAMLVQLTDTPGAETAPCYSPDGKTISFLKTENKPVAYRNSRVSVMNSDGSMPRNLTGELDASAKNLYWAAGEIYFQFEQRAMTKVASVDLRSRITIRTEDLGGTTLGRPYLSGSYHVSPDGIIVYTRGSPDRPADVAILRRGRAQTAKMLTDLNGDLLGHKRLGSVHEINYLSSFDQQKIQGWYLTPPDFDPDKKYPLILEIHGGPHSAYGANFSAEMQLMAAAGYVVFFDNYRGSTSYGEAFALLLQYKYASVEDFADHMSGVDAMLELGFVDAENLFIAGGSAGGIGTAYAIGLTDRFNAAVAAKPVINWISKTLTADSSVSQIRHQFPGYPWEHLEHFWQRSPLSLVGKVTTPTMLLTGEADRRTPISETEQYYQALKLLGTEAVMVRIPDSYHGIAGRPSRLITKVDHILAWFDRYTKKPLFQF